jgi:hypothetical protein
MLNDQRQVEGGEDRAEQVTLGHAVTALEVSVRRNAVPVVCGGAVL